MKFKLLKGEVESAYDLYRGAKCSIVLHPLYTHPISSFLIKGIGLAKETRTCT